jgi:predicted extracellular nuclease
LRTPRFITVIALNTLGLPYSQDFNSLAATGTSSTLPAGWFFAETGTNANTTYTAGTGSSNAGDTYSFGTAAADRALGGVLSGSLTPTFGAQFINSSGATFTSIQVSYTGEQWRLGTANRTVADRLDFQYSMDATSLSTGTWVNVDTLDFTAPMAGTVGLRDGNQAANRTTISFTFTDLTLPDGTPFWIRWTDFNASGADDGLAVDDFVITPSGTVNTTPTVNLSVSRNDGSEAAGTVVTVTATASAAVSGDQTVAVSVAGAGITAADYALSAAVITIPSGQTTGSVTFTVLDDNLIEPTETALISIGSPSAGITLGGTTSQAVALTDNDSPPVRIADIQGAQHLSPLNGKAVQSVEGIVTAIASNGFYMQDPLPDSNPATSDGILVFTGAGSALLSARTVGEAVKVSGTVTEFRPGNNVDSLTITEIVNNAAVQALVVVPWTNAPTTPIAPVVLGVDRVVPTQAINNDFVAPGNVETGGDFDPATEGIDFWESLEGMWVRVNAPVAVSPTLVSGSSEELYVLANDGAGATGRTARGGIVVSPGDFNPERLQIDDLDNTLVIPVVDVGARLSDVTGVIDYNSFNYELRITQSPTVVQASPLQREVSTLTGGADLLRVATFNVENLDPSDGAAKFNAVAAAIVGNLRSPDIVNLEEVQDNNGPTNNGVVAADVTMQTLVNAIAAAGGPVYQWRQLDPVNNQDGGEPGGNIRVVFLFDPARVGFVEGSLQRLTDTDLSNGDAFASSRKPLVGNFTFNGETLTLVGNHFNSKGGDDPLYGPTQPPVLGTEAQRDQQALIVKSFVQGLLTANPQAKVLVAGDLNDFEFSKPLTTLESTGLTSLIETLPPDERYTYNFQGNSQALDHIMASTALMPALRGYDVVHMNAEFAVQVSDHDPVVAQFLIERAGQVINGTRGRDNLVGTAGADTITGGPGRDVLTGGAGGDRFVYTSTLDAWDQITDFTPGSDRLVIQLMLASVGYAGSNPVGDGYLRVTPSSSGTTVLFDADGIAGFGAPRTLVELVGVNLSDATLLLDPVLS